jgi:trigger factor
MDENPKNNRPANITLLCGTHHDEATKRLLGPEQIRRTDSTPYNRQHGVSSPYGLHFQGEDFQCVIGGNTFSSRLRDIEHSTQAIALSVDDIDLLWFQIDRSGHLYLNANIFDENNLPLLVICQNSLVYRTAAWDIEFKGRILTVREAARRILFEIEFIPPRELLINRARLLCNGVEIFVRKQYVFVVNSQVLLVRCEAFGNDVGLQLGRNCRGLGAGFSVNPEAICRYFMPADEVRRRERESLRGIGADLDNTLQDAQDREQRDSSQDPPRQ